MKHRGHSGVAGVCKKKNVYATLSVVMKKQRHIANIQNVNSAKDICTHACHPSLSYIKNYYLHIKVISNHKCKTHV